jgi:pimeloyl-ACP methyl ester carboxylesterase
MTHNFQELDYYVQEFLKNGIEGPLNWYRTRKINYEDELEMPAEVKNSIKQPTLFVFANRDAVLKRELSFGMEKAIPNLTRGEVPAGHWALWQTAKETNAIIEEWFNGVVLGGKVKL